MPISAKEPGLDNHKVGVMHTIARNTRGKAPHLPCLLLRLTYRHTIDLRRDVTLDTPRDTPYISHGIHTSTLHTNHQSTAHAVTKSLS